MSTEKLKVVNLYNNKEFIPKVAGWIYNEFIDGHIDDFTHSDILELGFPKLYLRTETAGGYYSKHGWTRIEDLIDENGIETSVFNKTIMRKGNYN